MHEQCAVGVGVVYRGCRAAQVGERVKPEALALHGEGVVVGLVLERAQFGEGHHACVVVGEIAVVALGCRKRAGGVHDVVGKEGGVVVDMHNEQSLLGGVGIPTHMLVVFKQVVLVALVVVVDGIGLAALVEACHASHTVAGL